MISPKYPDRAVLTDRRHATGLAPGDDGRAPDLYVAIEMPTLAPVTCRTSTSSDICPISLEQLSRLPADDVFTVDDGKRYQASALKAWLSRHDTMPHTNLPASPETLAHFRPRRKFARPRSKIIMGLGIGASLALTSVSIGLFVSTWGGGSDP